VAPDILRTKLNARLYCGWPDERDQGLDVNNSPKVQKTISLEVREVMFSSRLKLDIAKVGAAVSKFLRGLARIVEHQGLSGGVTKDDRDPSWPAVVGLNLVEHLVLAFSVKTQDLPIGN
jgi:hypothetical protein